MSRNKIDWKKVDKRKMAQLRIAQWAEILRRAWHRQAPNANYYAQQPFIHGRLDHETMRHYIDQDERLSRALETDERLMVMRKRFPAMYAAVYIHYVMREPGSPKPLPAEVQWARFKKETGLNKTRFYELLRQAERDIALLD